LGDCRKLSTIRIVSRESLEIEYQRSWTLAQRYGLGAMNCGYQQKPTDTFHQHQQSLIWRMLAHVPIGPQSVVLDVGCGIGGPTAWVWERYRPRLIVGLDYCGTAIRVAESTWAGRDPRPYFVLADAHRLPIHTASVDVILNCESALHYGNKYAFLCECRRVLKPGGHLCLADITANSPRVWGWLTRPARGRVYLWSRKWYRKAFEECGLKVFAHEQASSAVAAALRTGLAEAAGAGAEPLGLPAQGQPGMLAAGQPGTEVIPAREVRRRFRFMRGLQILLSLQALTYDLFTAQAV
jgi:ubiquinone/menaquinone biosynthesis C-methylase UbiE